MLYEPWQNACQRVVDKAAYHLPFLNLAFIREAVSRADIDQALFYLAKVKALLLVLTDLRWPMLNSPVKQVRKTVTKAERALRHGQNVKRIRYDREMHEQGYLRYQELRAIANNGGLVRWRTTGVVEKLSTGTPGDPNDNRLFAEGPVTKRHCIPSRGNRYFWVEKVSPEMLISFNEIFESASKLATYRQGKSLLKTTFESSYA